MAERLFASALTKWVRNLHLTSISLVSPYDFEMARRQPCLVNMPATATALILPEGKALSAVADSESGDLLISGFAAVFAGQDRQKENFAEGAFQRAINSFLNGTAALCFHHKQDMVLGKVLSLEEVKGVGLRMTARVDGAIKNHPVLGTIYQQIKRGTISGLSIGGYFRRALTGEGRKIESMDFTEVSCTAVPTHAKTGFSVVEGKALEAASLLHDASNLEWLRNELTARRELDAMRHDLALSYLRTFKHSRR